MSALDDEELKSTRILNGADKDEVSMEEDIKILEEWIEETNKAWEKNDWLEEIPAPKEKIALESLIKGYREKEEVINDVKALTKNLKDYIPKSKIKVKIEEEIKYHQKHILDIENITLLKGKTLREEAEIEFQKYAIVVLCKLLDKLVEDK